MPLLSVRKQIHFSDRRHLWIRALQDKIVDRLCRQGRGKVFTPKDFLDIGSRDAVDQALSRLAKAETVQRPRTWSLLLPETSTPGSGLLSRRMSMRLRMRLPAKPEAGSHPREQRQPTPRAFDSGTRQTGLSHRWQKPPGTGRQFLVVVKHVSPKELPVGNKNQTRRCCKHCGISARMQSIQLSSAESARPCRPSR